MHIVSLLHVSVEEVIELHLAVGILPLGDWTSALLLSYKNVVFLPVINICFFALHFFLFFQVFSACTITFHFSVKSQCNLADDILSGN